MAKQILCAFNTQELLQMMKKATSDGSNYVILRLNVSSKHGQPARADLKTLE